MKINLPKNAEKLIKIAKSAGIDAYAVGGCVRDGLMGLIPKDWDITIGCPPEKIKEIFAGFKTVDTGIKYGTVSVIADGEIFEVTSFRAENEYRDFRHPEKLTFSDNINEDLKRRDFTVNAMAYSPYHGLIDLFGGKGDIEKKLLKCVGDPKERFYEDPLRILRGIRFAAAYGFETEKETRIAIFELMHLIKHISKERIKSELDKMLLNSKTVSKYLCEYEQVIKIALESENIEHAKKYIDRTTDLSVKWALILLNADISKLKLSNSLKKECKILKGFLNKSVKQDLISVRYMIKEYGFEMTEKIIEFKKATGENTVTAAEGLKKIKNEGLCCTLKELAVNGSDLISCEIKEKEKFREILDFLLNLVIEEKCPNIKKELLKKI